MSPQSIAAISVLACLLCALIGYLKGRRAGVAEGWLEHYFDEAKRDRSRRNQLGQFTTGKKLS